VSPSSSSFDFKEFDFSGAMRDISRGLLVKPILHNYLFDAVFPDFELRFKDHKMERDPDGWFHPSTHPMFNARSLYQYIAHPKTFPVEKKQYYGTLAVTLGTITHHIVEVSLTDAGIRPLELQKCEMCPPEKGCMESGVKDDDLGERGHMDGVLDLSGIPNVPIEKVQPVFEFKTGHDNFSRLTKMVDLDLAAFKEKFPIYWAQVQRYMRLSKRAWAIVVFMEPAYPFTMREFHVPYDVGFNAQIDAKYRAVRQAHADNVPPLCCGAKGCVSAPVCGILR
jgi:hypothetical protein